VSAEPGLAEVLGLDANLEVTVQEARTGELVGRRLVHNRVPLTVRNAVRDLLNGVGGGPSLTVGWFALGTGAAPPADGDTALGAEVFRDAVTSRIPSSGSLNVQYFLGTTSANGSTLTEAGLFNASAAGTLLARASFAGIAKTASLTVTFSWTISVNAG
jgi:hypothetical protein